MQKPGLNSFGQQLFSGAMTESFYLLYVLYYIYYIFIYDYLFNAEIKKIKIKLVHSK